MKKILGIDWRRIRVSGVGMAAVVGCLMIVAGWRGADAQTTGFDVVHATTELNGWADFDNQLTSNWELSNGYVVVKNTNGNSTDPRKFLTHNFPCANNGVYKVKFSRPSEPPPSLNGGVVFRFTDKSHFYYLAVYTGSWSNTSGKAVLLKNVVNLDQNAPASGTTGYLMEGTFTQSGAKTGENYEFEITLDDKKIKVRYSGNGTSWSNVLEYTDNETNANLSGKVGYAGLRHYSDQNGPQIRYISSSWANSTPTSYKVTWYPNGGTPIPTVTSVAPGGTITKPADMTKKDSTFGGWYTNASFTGTAVTFPIEKVMADQTFYAKWTPTPPGVPVPSGYTGYYVWNTDTDKTKFTGGNGKWSDPSWSNASSGSKGSWASGSNALFFAAPKGNVIAGGQTVGNIAFVEDGYSIDSGSLVLGKTIDTINVVGDAKATINSILSGTTGRGITKIGTGTLILTGENTYTGTTTVSAGNLQIGNGGAGSINGGPINLGTTATNRIIFNNGANNVTYPGVISGSGGVTKKGAGTLTIANAVTNTYTGATTIEEGTFVIYKAEGVGGGAGAITIGSGATLRLNCATSGSASTLSKAINGDGTFVKEGVGPLTQSAAIGVAKFNIDAGTVNASAAITSDLITVGGSTGSARLNTTDNLGKTAGTITVNTNGVLSDSGALTYTGSVNVTGGTLEHKGTKALTITGPLTLSSASTLNLQLNHNAKTTPLVAVSGALALGGSTLNITSTITNADTGTYTIISGGSVTGTFAKVTTLQEVAYSVSTAVNGTNVTLTIALKGGNDIIVMFDPSGGSVNPTFAPVNPTTGKLASLPTPTKDGYTFDGWFTAGGAKVTEATVYDKTTTIFAQWTQTTPTGGYTITFNVNGGAALNPSTAKTDAYGYLASLPTPTRTGYTFDGWFTLATGGTEVTKDYQYTANTDIYAQWTIGASGYTVTFNADGGTVSPTSAKTNTDGYLTNLPTPNKSDFTFDGWFLEDGTTEVTTDYQYRANTTIYAHWSEVASNTPNNPVTLDARQIDSRKTTVAVTLMAGNFNEFAATVRVEMSLKSSMTDLVDNKSIPINEIKADEGYKYNVINDAFVGAICSVYYRITVLDAKNVGGGEVRRGSFAVGRAPPTPVIDFRAEAGNGSMDLFWNPITISTANGIGDLNLAYVKVYYSESPISPNTNVSTLIPIPVDSVPASMTRPTVKVTDLSQNKTYYFAAVLFDVVDKTKPAWTLSSPAAVCSGTTGSGNVFDNVLGIDTAYFDNKTNSFTVTVKLKDNWNASYKFGYMVTLGADTVISNNAESPPSSASKTGEKFTFTTDLNTVVFDTVYIVYVYTINGSSYSRRDSWPVKMGAFTNQTVVVKPGASESVDNGNFKIDAVGWTVGAAPCTTTVSGSAIPADAQIVNKGFIAVGNYGYKYTAKAGGDLSILGQFTIRMKTNVGIPAGYTANDVKLYRWSGEYWEVVYDTKYENGYFVGTAIDSVYVENTNSNYVYRLLINTGYSATGDRMPRVSTTGYTETVDESKAIYESYNIVSNVGNCKISLIYGRANGEAVLSAAKPTFANSKEKGELRTVSFTISDSVVQLSVNNGILSFIIVDDGKTKDTLNYSHRIRSSSSAGFSVVPTVKKWLPFAAQVELDDRNIKTTLRQLFYQDADDVTTDSTLYLLYRWYETSDNKNKGNKWVEFNGSNDSAFKMDPSRLMWLKTSKPAMSMILGSAVSVSLRDTVKIALPPKQWTDFVIPFRFNVCLGDILNATKAGSKSGTVPPMEFYKWTEPENSKKKHYITDWLVLASADSSVELKGGDDPFTIYNDNSTTDTLRIPPRPAFMSRYYKANTKRGLTKTAAYTQETGGAWHYTLRTNTDDAVLPNVLIGYNTVERTFAVPPSFGDESVVLVDDNGVEMGHHFGPSIVSGHTYKLRFYNDGRQRTVFKFSAQPSDNAPYNARITFVRASTSEILSGHSEHSISVAAMSYEDVFMIIGNSSYRAKAATVTAGAKFGIDRISVNRAARSARITYYVPASGVERVEASIYDIKGRQVWRNVQTVKPAAWNAMEWNGKGAKTSGTSTGLYILRVKAIGPNGTAVGVDHKRIMFAR